MFCWAIEIRKDCNVNGCPNLSVVIMYFVAENVHCDLTVNVMMSKNGIY